MRSAEETLLQPFHRVAKGGVADYVLEDLRGRILDGQLPRGAKLPTEKQLAENYGVSGPTIREAIRGLTTAQLVEVRHGSGTYVTADADQLIESSLISMMQLERVGISQVLGVLGVLNEYAAETASLRATNLQIQALRDAAAQIEKGSNAAEIAEGLHKFVDALASASGNVLLAVLCRFLASVQVALAKQLTGDSYDTWKKTTGLLAKDRKRLIEAIAAHDPSLAREAARKHSSHSAKVIASLPHAQDTKLSHPTMAGLLASMLEQG
jgi:GntR family transcriptional repressor for pyruvate dehydrogenase complex